MTSKPTKEDEVAKKRRKRVIKIVAVVGVLALTILAVSLIIYFLTDENDRQEEDANVQVTDA